ncbi:unnamed protein product [Coregonus sp. 'balchen']|nr:unnamed protein product [Coregonus sp. 'balchen']
MLPALQKSQPAPLTAKDAFTLPNLVNDEPMCEEDFCSYQDLHKQTEKQRALQSSMAETPLPVYYRQGDETYPNISC